MLNIKNIIIVCLGLALVVESFFLLSEKKDGVDLKALNQLDALGVVEKYLLSHETGKDNRIILRLLDDYYSKSDEFLVTHSDIFNIKDVSIKSIEEVKLNEQEIEERKEMAVKCKGVGSANIEDVKRFNVTYNLTPIDEEKPFLIDESFEKEESIYLIKTFGIWVVFDRGNG